MNRLASTIVGRDLELLAIAKFLDRVSAGPGALVLEGSAGIGKTTLWAAGVSAARERAFRVLTTRAAESEARLSYAALGDLLGAVPDSAFAGMPALLRQALDAALLQGDEPGHALDQRAVSLATAHALRNLAADAPLIIGVDDVQWLDHPSARVLSFALRRVSDDRIGAFVSLRLSPGSAGDLLELDRAGLGTTHLTVGQLGSEPLGRMLREQTGVPLPRPVIARLHRVTDGNPLFALEMARAVTPDDAGAARGDIWSVPDDLQKLLSARLAAVPVAARGPLLAIAASTRPTWDLVVQVADSNERVLDALGRAEEAGIIERADGRVRFTHPLLSSTLYLNASDAERYALHLRLSTLTADSEERARHLALSANGPDADVARTLEDAAHLARARAAPDAAADLAELACDKTPAVDVTDLRRRRLVAAEYRFDGGDADRARQLLKETISTTPPGPARARMLYRLGSMGWNNLINGVRTPCETAVEEAGDDPGLLSGIHDALAWVAFYRGDLAGGSERIHESLAFAMRAPDPAMRAVALAGVSFFAFLRGDPFEVMAADAIAQGDDAMRGRSWTEVAVYTSPRLLHGVELLWSFRLAEAREVIEHELAEQARLAMYTVNSEPLGLLAYLECHAGNWQRAAQLAAEAVDVVEESGQSATQLHVVYASRAWPAALLGEVDLARRLATEGALRAIANDDLFNGAWNESVLGFLDLSLGDHANACRHLELAAGFDPGLDAVPPGMTPCHSDLIETYAALGRLADAERLIARLDGRTTTHGGRWASAMAARGRALVAAARGDLGAAEAAAETSIPMLNELGLPFEAGRSRLVLGQVQRRAKKKRAARDHLEAARDTFDRLGAAIWVERARGELARIGGRSPSPFELTETEQQIADLVAQGRTNQETADALFVSPSTVQASLKRIYQKLGVRSRTELAAKVGRESTS